LILRTKTAELLRVLKKMLLLLAKMEERPSLEVTKKSRLVLQLQENQPEKVKKVCTWWLRNSKMNYKYVIKSLSKWGARWTSWTSKTGILRKKFSLKGLKA